MSEKTIKLYDENAYLTEFEARVVSCKPAEGRADCFETILDKTLFFPEEGGQTPDKGTIEMISGSADGKAVKVLDVQIKGDVIIHYTDSPLEVDVPVKGSIDFEHRFSNMQQHSGEHIFSGIVNRLYGYDNVGFHLSDSVVTMDYSGQLSKEQLSDIELRVNRAIYENVPIICRYPSADELEKLDYRSKKELTGNVRIVTVEGYDTCACCAPHVARTGEIGILKIVSSQNYKGGTRVSILCGKRALLYLSDMHEMITGLANSLTTSVESIPELIRKQQDEIAALKRSLSEAGEKILLSEAAELPSDSRCVFMFADKNSDANVIRRVVTKLVADRQGYLGIFFGDDTDGYRFIIGCASGLNSNDILNVLKEKFQVRGGGAPAMVQGSLSGASKEDILGVASMI
jgi:alanyl-tRNA synthetase